MPEYIQNRQILKDFISAVANQTGVGGWWVVKWREHFYSMFIKIPPTKLQFYLDNYLRHHFEGDKPPVPLTIKKFILSKSDASKEWFFKDQGNVYCRDCRTDEHGKEGGNIVVWYRFKNPKTSKYETDTFSARCICEPCITLGLTGKNYQQKIRSILLVDPNATIRRDHYCGPDCSICGPNDKKSNTFGKVRASMQSDDMFLHRVKEGYFGYDNDSDVYYPIWEHDIWASSLGRIVARSLGLERPDFVLDKEKKRRRIRRKNNPNWDSTRLPDETIDKMFGPYGW